MPYMSVVSMSARRSARTMASRMTGPRSDPTWTVPDGVLLSLTTCGPLTLAASSSAQSMIRNVSLVARADRVTAARPGQELADADDLVGEVSGGHLHDDLLAFLLAEQGPPDRALVADPTLGRPCFGRADDRERLLAIVAGDLDGRPDLDVVGRVVLVDDRRVLDERLE